jgi:hypothetical protein
MVQLRAVHGKLTWQAHMAPVHLALWAHRLPVCLANHWPDDYGAHQLHMNREDCELPTVHRRACHTLVLMCVLFACRREILQVGSKLNFRSPARQVRIDTDSPDFISWDDINGIDEVKQEIQVGAAPPCAC